VPRAIDHLVIPSRDLAAQADLYRRLGFQVGRRNRHPFGTENHVIQLHGAYLEPIGLGEGFSAPAEAPSEFSFARFVARFLERHEGLAMIALRSSNAEKDRRDFEAKGIGGFKPFAFSRQTLTPNGATAEVKFSLAFAKAPPALGDFSIFACQHHRPDLFWSEAAQRHPNGALKIAGLGFGVERPKEAAEFLARAFDAAEVEAIPEGLGMSIEGARVLVGTPEGVARAYALPEPLEGAPPLALAAFHVADLAHCRETFRENGVHFAEAGSRLIVAEREAMGAWLAFEATGRSLSKRA